MLTNFFIKWLKKVQNVDIEISQLFLNKILKIVKPGKLRTCCGAQKWRQVLNKATVQAGFCSKSQQKNWEYIWKGKFFENIKKNKFFFVLLEIFMKLVNFSLPQKGVIF